MDNLIGTIIFLWAGASWFTHLIICFQEGAWGFLVAGGLFFPIALVHGTGIWFGLW